MNEILVVLEVVGLFMLRIGLPILLLVALGVLIDRWQTRRAEELRMQMQVPTQKPADLSAHRKADENKRKAA